jgi:hypothetical protein
LWASTSLLVAACGAESTPPVEVVESFDEASGSVTMAGSIRFADGTRVSEVRISPAPLVPGGACTVRWKVASQATAETAQIGVLPPRSGARQVLRERGPQPLDPRDRWLSASVSEGAGEAEVVLPAPWHPRTAMVVMKLEDSSGDLIPATHGPRTAAGLAVLASVAVQMQPTEAVAQRVETAPVLDGRLDDPVWGEGAYALVHSVDGEPFSGDPTRVYLAYDVSSLYVAADLPDRDLWTTYTQHDDPLYKQEVFEVFISGSGDGNDYLEYQVSARNVTFDARFARYRRGDTGWNSGFETAVEVRGTIGDRSDRDHGWSVELAIPWPEICENTGVSCPPQAGQRLRINAFRLEHPRKEPAYGLALSPTRTPDFHAWGNAAVLVLGS